MNIDLLHALTMNETDVSGTLERFGGDESLYVYCLAQFLNDPTLEELRRALQEKEWDDAFTAAHALKGLAGNMGFVPLYHSLGELVVAIRSGRLGEIEPSFRRVEKNYDEITAGIRGNFGDTTRDYAGREQA